jgi:hypothetical protein
MPDLINITLSVTVDGEEGVRASTVVLTDALRTVMDEVPNVQGASLTLYRDDFLGAEAEAKSEPADKVHIAVADADAAADALRELREPTITEWSEMTFEEQERVRKGKRP